MQHREADADTPFRAGPVDGAPIGPDPARPVFAIHSLAQAVAALRAAAAAGRGITLLSAPAAGIYAGPGWFGALINAAREAVPDSDCCAMLDCGAQPGAALAAIRASIESVIFVGRAEIAHRLTDIACRQGVRLFTARPVVAVNLLDAFLISDAAIEQRCADFLASA